MRILLTGKNGQVGYELERSLQSVGEVHAFDRSQMDLADLDQVRDVIRSVKPGLIVNAAAYTAVDKAESEPALAMRINGEAPGVMAEEARNIGAAMVHYSTDYVFDGTKTAPYTEDDATCPVNEYGRSKLAGERAIQACGIPHFIFRTSWVYGMRGANFLLTMRRLAAERGALKVVADQCGSPTWCRTIADATAQVLGRMKGGTVNEKGGNDAVARQNWQEQSGIYHLTAQGQTTWHGFAQAIVMRFPDARNAVVTPIATADYPTPAKRPANSVLSSERFISNFCCLPDWQTGLDLCVE